MSFHWNRTFVLEGNDNILFNTLGAVPPPHPLISFTSRGPRAPGEKPCLQRYPFTPPPSLPPKKMRRRRKKNHLRRVERSHVSSLPKLPVHLISAAVASSRDGHFKKKKKRGKSMCGGGGWRREEGDKQWQPCIFFLSFINSQWCIHSRREWGVHSRDITQVAFTASPPSASDKERVAPRSNRKAISHL